MTTRIGITGFYLPSAGNYIAAQVTAKNSDGTLDIVTWPEGASTPTLVNGVSYNQTQTEVVGAFNRNPA